MPEVPQHIAVSLSGGGHRAALFGLGGLLYLVDADKGPELSSISSVSGGSLTNGFVAITCDLGQESPDEMWRKVRPLAAQVASRGTVWSSLWTFAYLAALAALLIIPTVLAFFLSPQWAILVAVVGIIAAGFFAQQRSRVVARALDHALFNGQPLEDMNLGINHVLCSTELQTAESVYFSGDFVYASRLGWGIPGRLRLARAVQASAAFPGAFNAVTLPVKRHRFPRTIGTSRLRLADGGVYDNMGTEWPIRLRRRSAEGQPPDVTLLAADEIIVLNASAGRGVDPRPSLGIPILGELATLLAVKDVMYDQTTAVRRRLLDLRFRAARGGLPVPDGNLSGAMVQIDRSPFDVPDAFRAGADDMAGRARAALELLGDGTRAKWKEEAAKNSAVRTALSTMPVERALSLVRQAYVLTMVNCHVLLGYPLREIPEDDRFRALVS